MASRIKFLCVPCNVEVCWINYPDDSSIDFLWFFACPDCLSNMLHIQFRQLSPLEIINELMQRDSEELTHFRAVQADYPFSPRKPPGCKHTEMKD